MTPGWIYIITDRENGTLYTGVTGDLVQRITQHREGQIDGVAKDCGLTRLVYFEQHDDLARATQYETAIKHWPRSWKENLVLSTNPFWHDLFNRLG
jgi:putative endonuclease